MADTDLDDLTEIADASNVGDTDQVVAQPAGNVAPVRVPISILRNVFSAGLPVGNEALDELRWRNGMWTPISPVTTSYGAMTREGTFASLKTLFDAVANEPRGLGVSADGVLVSAREAISVGNDETFRVITMDAVWPVGDSAPWVWVLFPRFPRIAAVFYRAFLSPDCCR